MPPEPPWRSLHLLGDHPQVHMFLEALDDGPRHTAEALRAMVHEVVPHVREAIYHDMPFFFVRRPLCYLSTHRFLVSLGFSRGADIIDRHALLQGARESPVRKVGLQPGQSVPRRALVDLLRQAVVLDLRHPEPLPLGSSHWISRSP